MRPGWKECRHGFTRREIGAISMGTAYGMSRGDGYVATCRALGIELKGFDSHEAAQEAVEREAERRLEAALFALRAP